MKAGTPAALLVLLTLTAPSLALQYSARKVGDVVQLEDPTSQTRVSILPSVGNITFEMSVKGHNVLRWPYASIEEFKSRPGLNGLPFLAPWANRLDEPAFYANGRKYTFDQELGNVRGAIPIHGFLSQTDQWHVVELKSDARSAWVTSRLDFYRQPSWMKQFPFAHTIEITHRLQAGALEVRTKITNMSADPMPVAIGFHPYFQLTDSPRTEWTVSVPARTHWILAATKVPTGETEPIEKLMPDPQNIALRDYNLDDVFSDLARDPQERATAVLKGKQQRLEIMLGRLWRSLVLYSPNPAGTGLGSNAVASSNAPPRGATTQTPNVASTANFICFEPMAAISDGMNLAQKQLYKDLQYIAPGGTWQESFWIKPSGF
jgi:aldose 1-epimerase